MIQKAFDIRVHGLVQGVGFRPFVYHLATSLNLAGWALNRNDCVQIRVQGEVSLVDEFVTALQTQAPPLSRIESVATEDAEWEELEGFVIQSSQSHSADVTRVSPDMAVCQECLDDMTRQPNRLNYPFVNCTNCGSRFSIIRDLPYDRAQTTMQPFVMCPSCQQEYEDISNRRFHAQPNACRDCGPEYELLVPTLCVGTSTYITGMERILDVLCELLEGGKIVAMKGVGGFHLACDAMNEEAVKRLRQRKQREGKPFAVMFGNIETVRKYSSVSKEEKRLLLSEKRPIMLLKTQVFAQVRNTPLPPSLRQNSGQARGEFTLRGESTACTSARMPNSPLACPEFCRREGGREVSNSGLCNTSLAPSVALGLNSLGVMLPYTPLHYLLFHRFKTDAIVLTSGNISDEPIVISNEDAERKLAPIADALLIYNREIHNRSDDSVVCVVNDAPRLLRRSRGWVPEPITLPFEVEGIVATGAELKNCFCVGKGTQAILSQHIGNLKNLDTYEFYTEAFERFTRLFRVKPKLIACDLHPDYLSSRFARESGLNTITVQHHHAHIAACMAEFGLHEPVIGISFDGTGLGDDQRIWGGEFLICDLKHYTRFTHFDYILMPGGDKAAEEPWRMAVSYLYRSFGRAFLTLDIPFVQQLDMNKVELLLAAMERGIQCPQTSSAGRLFDGVAAILNLVTTNSFEAEAPIRLESLIGSTEIKTTYPYQINGTVCFEELIRALVADVAHHVPKAAIAAKFHKTLAAIILDVANLIRIEHGLETVVLSGGVFQNRYLLAHAENKLRDNGFSVYSPLLVPANDGGVCLGQLAVAANTTKTPHACIGL